VHLQFYMTHICKFCYLFVAQKMGTPIDPSIALLKTQQVANDAQSNPVEEAENSPNIEEVEDVERSPNKRGLTYAAWIHFKRKKIEEKWKSICKYCEKNLVVIQGQVRSICTITLEPVSFEQ